MQITTIGLDLAKHVFQVHGCDAAGNCGVKRRLRRNQVLEFFAGLAPCLVGIEACGTAHHWARELRALGHDVRLMPAHYVKAYVKRGKNDAADAAAICEAVSRPSMRFVPIKTREQQAVLTMHRTRDLLMRQRTQLINAVRGHLAEFGIVEPQGVWHLGRVLRHLEVDDEVIEPARQVIGLLASQLNDLEGRIKEVDKQIALWHKASPTSQRLATIPGIGPVIASAIAATVPDAGVFRSGREFAAWLGLVPRQRSTGGKQRLGRITRDGDRYIRRLLIMGAQARPAKFKGGACKPVDPKSSSEMPATESRRGTGQQDRPHRMGSDDEGRNIPAGCCVGVGRARLQCHACEEKNWMEQSVDRRIGETWRY